MNITNNTFFPLYERLKYSDNIECLRDELLGFSEEHEALELNSEEQESKIETLEAEVTDLEETIDEQKETIKDMRKALDDLKPIIDELYALPDFEDFKEQDYKLFFDSLLKIDEIASA